MLGRIRNNAGAAINLPRRVAELLSYYGNGSV
jgi:hypothetical protein